MSTDLFPARRQLRHASPEGGTGVGGCWGPCRHGPRLEATLWNLSRTPDDGGAISTPNRPRPAPRAARILLQ